MFTTYVLRRLGLEIHITVKWGNPLLSSVICQRVVTCARETEYSTAQLLSSDPGRRMQHAFNPRCLQWSCCYCCTAYALRYRGQRNPDANGELVPNFVPSCMCLVTILQLEDTSGASISVLYSALNKSEAVWQEV
jgi:hypothetical protein